MPILRCPECNSMATRRINRGAATVETNCTLCPWHYTMLINAAGRVVDLPEPDYSQWRTVICSRPACQRLFLAPPGYRKKLCSDVCLNLMRIENIAAAHTDRGAEIADAWTLVCQRCNNKFQAKKRFAKYCPGCRRLTLNDNTRRWREKQRGDEERYGKSQ